MVVAYLLRFDPLPDQGSSVNRIAILFGSLLALIAWLVGALVYRPFTTPSRANPHAFGDRVRYPLALNNWYSIEHHATTPIAEWDYRTLRVNIEEDSILTERGIEFLVPRQTEWLLIPSDA